MARGRPKNLKNKAKVKDYNLSYDDMAKMSARERHAYYSKLRAIAVKRLQRLSESGYADSQVYRDYRDEFVSLKYANFSEGDIANLIHRVQNFLNRKDSTVRGQQRALKDAVRALHEAKPNLPEVQMVLKTDKDGNVMYEREEAIDKRGRKYTRFKYEEVYNPATGKMVKRKIPMYEEKLVGAYDWITEQNALEVFKFIDMVRERAGGRLIYDPNELHELWSYYRQTKNKDFDTNKQLKKMFNMLMGSRGTSFVVSTARGGTVAQDAIAYANAYKEMQVRQKQKQARAQTGKRGRGRPRKNRR